MQDVKRHLSYLSVGMNSYATAIGGLIAFVIFALTLALTDASREVWISMATFFLACMAVVYDCGRRVVAAERKRLADVTKDGLGLALGMIENRIMAIRLMSDEQYFDMARANGDSETHTLMKQMGQFLGVTHGFGETMLVSSATGMPEVKLEQTNPKAVYKKAVLHYLTHFAKNLKGLIERAPK